MKSHTPRHRLRGARRIPSGDAPGRGCSLPRRPRACRAEAPAGAGRVAPPAERDSRPTLAPHAAAPTRRPNGIRGSPAARRPRRARRRARPPGEVPCEARRNHGDSGAETAGRQTLKAARWLSGSKMAGAGGGRRTSGRRAHGQARARRARAVAGGRRAQGRAVGGERVCGPPAMRASAPRARAAGWCDMPSKVGQSAQLGPAGRMPKRSKFDQCWLEAGKIGPSPTKFGQCCPQSDLICPELIESWPNFGPDRSEFGPHRPNCVNFGQTRSQEDQQEKKQEKEKEGQERREGQEQARRRARAEPGSLTPRFPGLRRSSRQTPLGARRRREGAAGAGGGGRAVELVLGVLQVRGRRLEVAGEGVGAGASAGGPRGRGRAWREVQQAGAGPSFTKSCPSSINVDRVLADLDQCWPKSANVRRSFRTLVEVAQNRPHSPQSR